MTYKQNIFGLLISFKPCALAQKKTWKLIVLRILKKIPLKKVRLKKKLVM